MLSVVLRINRWVMAVLIGVAFLMVRSASPTAQASRAMALTFDDLPYVSIDGDNAVAKVARVYHEISGVLSAHRAPAVAFVNEDKLGDDGETKARTDILKSWVEAGVILGNHTYGHIDLNSVSIESFEDQILRGEAVSRRLMAGRQPYQLYFRHPFTHTGDTAGKKDAVAAFLARHGYRTAPHTIDTSDYLFNAAYVRAIRAQDRLTGRKIVEAYLTFSDAATAFAERAAVMMFRRDIPQTLVIHANDLNADQLDALLSRFEARGYRFISLAEAMRDEAYRTSDTLVTPAGPTWLWRWNQSLGLSVSFRDDPDPPSWVSDLAAQVK